MKVNIRFLLLFIFTIYIKECYSQDKDSFYSNSKYKYVSDLNFNFFYNPFFPALSVNTSYNRSINRNEKLALGVVYNYAWLGSEDDNSQSIGMRLLYRFFSSRKFDIYGGLGGSYGNMRLSPFYKESLRPTYYFGGKYFFSDRFGALLEVSNYRVSGEVFPVIGISYRYGKRTDPLSGENERKPLTKGQ